MRVRRGAALAAVAAGVLAALTPLTPQAASWNGPDAVALLGDGTRLGRFDTDRPSRVGLVGGRSIRGLDGDDRLVGIDRRVQNGRLYGVGDEGGIYLMSGERASKVGQLSVALAGASFGVDFNPAANALRVVSDTGQNLRQPFGSGAGPTGATVADGALNVMGTTTTGIAGAAYTNNDLSDTTATTLFDLDTKLDQIAVQAPANSGSLSPTGKLGVDAGAEVGFDIYSDLRRSRTVSNVGFAVIGSSPSRLYQVDLLTGAVRSVGRFPVKVTDVAVDLDR